jgi:hypothetical protein
MRIAVKLLALVHLAASVAYANVFLSLPELLAPDGSPVPAKGALITVITLAARQLIVTGKSGFALPFPDLLRS